MFIGRVAERGVIDDLLRRARAGRSGALVVCGDPGIGKSALLRYAEQHADGFTVLGARGYESESEIPFAGLADLLGPVLERRSALPAPQRAALESALSLGPPAGGDRFSVCAATIGMLAAAATDEPLLAVIDDVHWLDVSSREAVLFAARRLAAEGVALLLATRPGAEREFTGLARLALTGLDETDAVALLRAELPDAKVEMRRRIYAETAGNPLGLRELCEQVRATGAPTDEPRPGTEHLQSSLTRALAARLAELPERTRAALLLVAAGAGAETDVVLRAAAGQGLTLADFAPAETAGLLRSTARRVEFTHPMLRTVLYDSAPMHARSSAHAALAGVLADRPGDADARAWHLAAATLPPHDGTMQLLRAAADRARARGGNREAARAYEEAARFAADPEARAALALRAARAWQLAGHTARILPLLDEALTLGTDPGLRALARHMSGYVQMWRALPRDGLAEMLAGAGEIEQRDPGRAARMYADAALAHFMLGEPAELQRATGRAFAVAARADDVTRLIATVAHAAALVINGRRAEGAELLERVRDPLLHVDPITRAQELAHAAFAWMWLGDHATAEVMLDRIVGRGREIGALGVLPQALSMISELAFRTGRWSRAKAAAEESVALARETRQANLYGRYFVARLAAMQGRSGEAEHLLAKAAEQAARHQAGCMELFIGHTLGVLALGSGDHGSAIARLERVGRLPMARETRDQAVVPWAFDLAEAYARAGRPVDAQRLLDEHAADGDHLAGLAGRVRGRLAPKDQLARHFEAALAAHERCGMPFERARTALAYGERLRRFRSRGSARAHLLVAHEIFEQLDAVSWLERVRAELAAAGGGGETTVRAAAGPPWAGALTPQELQVAMVVAGGASNQEAAASLFLSPKTIEYHLSNIYRKANLRSRNELAVLV